MNFTLSSLRLRLVIALRSLVRGIGRVTDATSAPKTARPLKVLVYSDDVNTRQQVILALGQEPDLSIIGRANVYYGGDLATNLGTVAAAIGNMSDMTTRVAADVGNNTALAIGVNNVTVQANTAVAQVAGSGTAATAAFFTSCSAAMPLLLLIEMLAPSNAV